MLPLLYYSFLLCAQLINDETIQHLARSISHMFNSWLSNQSKKIRNVIWVWVAAICWAIWRCRNDIIFNKIKVNSILQVIFRGTYWFRFWAQLQRRAGFSLPAEKFRNFRNHPSTGGARYFAGTA